MRFKMPVIKLNIKTLPGQIKSTAINWKNYFMYLPARAKQLTRRQIKIKVARYIFSFVLAYFIVGILLGVGFYTKRIPLGNSFGYFWASIYPYPAEIVGLKAVTLRDLANQERIIYYFAKSTGSDLGDRLDVDSKVMETVEETRLAQGTLDQYNIKVSKADVDNIMKQIEDENGGADSVKNLLQSLYGIDTNQFKSIVKDQLAKDKVTSDVLKNVMVYHILVDSEDKAKEIKGKIDNKETTFTDAAKEFSKDTEANKSDGLVTASTGSQYVNRDSGLAIEFIDAAMKANQDEVTGPIKTEFGWHLILVKSVKGSLDETYADWLKSAKSHTVIWRLYRP